MIGCYHVVSTNFDQITARVCTRTTSDGPCVVDATETVELVLKDASRVLPFDNRHVCYRFSINNESGVNVVSGCPSIHLPENALSAKSILNDAVMRAGAKDIKTKLARAFKRFEATRTKELSSAAVAYTTTVREVFDDAELAEDFRASFRAAHGWFFDCPCMRTIGKGLFCMGFHDREKVRGILRTLSSEPEGPEWFESVGHGGLDERDEDFKQLYARFRKMDANFLLFIREVALEDPDAFFSADSRPMALRGLGGLNRDFFAQFCIDINMAPLPARDPTITLIDGEKHSDATVVLRVGNAHITANTMGLARTLVALKAKGVLRFASETDTIRRPGALYDCGKTLSGKGNTVREVHNICSTKRLCLGFDSAVTGRTDIDTLKNRFMTATAPPENGDVALFVRDAHLLGCSQLSHILWRVAARAALRDLVFTTRFEYDAVYAGAGAPFIASLSNSMPADTTPPALPGTTPLKTVPDITPDSLSSFSGVCVVPTARDAANTNSSETPKEGSGVFVVSPPLFGRVVRVNGRRSVTIALPVEGRETEVSMFDGKKNVWSSATTSARGVLIPVSALLFQRKRFPMCSAKATVFVPSCFSAERKRDLIDAVRGFFRIVVVVEVTAYDEPENDNTVVQSVMQAIEESCALTG